MGVEETSISMDDPRHDRLSAATNQLPASWWYRFYFSPPALSAGARGAVTT
jgi:hypothetical protein